MWCIRITHISLDSHAYCHTKTARSLISVGFWGAYINYSPLFMLISSFTRVKVNQVYIQILAQNHEFTNDSPMLFQVPGPWVGRGHRIHTVPPVSPFLNKSYLSLKSHHPVYVVCFIPIKLHAISYFIDATRIWTSQYVQCLNFTTTLKVFISKPCPS